MFILLFSVSPALKRRHRSATVRASACQTGCSPVKQLVVKALSLCWIYAQLVIETDIVYCDRSDIWKAFFPVLTTASTVCKCSYSVWMCVCVCVYAPECVWSVCVCILYVPCPYSSQREKALVSILSRTQATGRQNVAPCTSLHSSHTNRMQRPPKGVVYFSTRRGSSPPPHRQMATCSQGLIGSFNPAKSKVAEFVWKFKCLLPRATLNFNLHEDPAQREEKQFQVVWRIFFVLMVVGCRQWWEHEIFQSSTSERMMTE